jgi:hydrophobic/amphiphilic exporter-1 (mainly G- bacteria), HAE1 family
MIMFSRFFIERPIFANVIAIMTMLVGAVTIYSLPIERYPDITPPTVLVSTVYPGADARVLADTVATLVEQEVNGVQDMLYMSSTCSSDGSYKLTVTFEVGTDLDRAQVLVQNRLAIAQPRLPAEVQRQGITAKKQSTNIILAASLISPDNRFDDLFLSNYASLYVKDELSRIYGVGEVQVIGAGNYGMRIWIDPEKLKARNLTTEVVLAAVREQNVQVAAGQVGQYPSPSAQGFQYNVTTLGRLSTPEEFEEIIIKSEDRGLMDADDRGGGTARLTRLKDVARVELGSQAYEQWCEIGGKPAATLAVFQLPGANALDVAKRVEQAMEKLKVKFPEGLEYIIPFNTTIFVEESIHEVYKTLFEAGILVLVVILVFLQDWRAVLIPATTVPVTIIGAFAAMGFLGFSINMLTLFGLVLAIGIVVDDAIVIVENAAHHIDHGGLSAKEATIKAMSEVIGPIIGITLVLMAVFLPTAFLGGITGQLYRQFALTIAATAIISAINAVTLKPAQCATYLRPTKAKKNLFYRAFNNVYGRCEALYTKIIHRAVRHVAVMMLAFVALVALSGWWFTRLPTGFLPTEDQGFAILGVQLPDAASQTRTRAVVDKVSAILKQTPGVQSWFLIGGQSIMDQAVASNASAMYITFTPWSERDGKKGLSQDEIIANLMGQFQQIREAMVFVFPPPALMGLGTAGGFEMLLEDRGNVGLKELQQVVAEMIEAGNGQKDARNQPILVGLQSTFRAEVPTLYADVDRVKAKSLGVSLDVVFGTLQTALGSAYVNDFNKFGKSYQVRVQADQRFRLEPEDIRKLEVRNAQGQMVPLGTLVKVEKRLGPQIIPRYNMYSAATINGRAAAGYSSGQALNLMEEMAGQKLTSAMGFDWTGMSFQEKRVGSQAIFVFGLAVLMVYLVLAAQYESWFLPAAVILVVPLALLGTVIAVAVRGMDNNIYTQIGIVLIIALASKNAILIVEFARELRSKGRSILDAAVEASRQRFRPILMTSFAFILGIWPLVNATGAGAAGRRSLGTAVFGGMLAATVLAVFFVPVFYVLMQRLSEFRFKSALEWIAKRKAIAVPHAVPVGVHLHANGQSRHGSGDEVLETVQGSH